MVLIPCHHGRSWYRQQLQYFIQVVNTFVGFRFSQTPNVTITSFFTDCTNFVNVCSTYKWNRDEVDTLFQTETDIIVITFSKSWERNFMLGMFTPFCFQLQLQTHELHRLCDNAKTHLPSSTNTYDQLQHHRRYHIPATFSNHFTSWFWFLIFVTRIFFTSFVRVLLRHLQTICTDFRSFVSRRENQLLPASFSASLTVTRPPWLWWSNVWEVETEKCLLLLQSV